MGSAQTISKVTGHPPGPYPVGVTTVQFDDWSRRDQDEPEKPRRLQTEIWYPASEDARGAPKSLYSECLGRGAIEGSIEAAEASTALGGYREGLTIAELDAMWPGESVRDARPRNIEGARKWPLVVFSHGSGAFRASYIYFTEFLASQGFVVVACDHPGSSRYTQLDGQVVTPGGKRSERATMEADRPQDLRFLIDAMSRAAAGGDSRFAGRVDCKNVALTGMSFGGFSTAAALEFQDPRVKAAILKCASIAASAGGKLGQDHANKETPVLVMTGREDLAIKQEGNEACERYYESHTGPKCFVELVKGGHVSFTSCEIYNPEYGNGIGSSCPSLTAPGEKYEPTAIVEQHTAVNAYALAFLDAHLRGSWSLTAEKSLDFLRGNHFEGIVNHRAAL